MITPISDKPDCLDFLPETASFFEVKLNDITCGYYGVEIADRVAHLHLVIKVFTPRTFDTITQSWPLIKDFCKENGCKHLVASKKGSKRELNQFTKLIKHFGFNEPERACLAIQEV